MFSFNHLSSKYRLMQTKIQLNRRQQKFLFLLGITAIYVVLVIWRDFLQGAYLWDEKNYWESSLVFSDRLFPSIDELRNYNELSTPLPFIVFGILQYLFDKGIFLGRLLNLIMSVAIAFIIGYPSRNKSKAILCVIGLFLCPYYLFYSGVLYTDIFACFWVLVGVMSYVRNRHWLSCIAFILAIASRQYMLAFPMAIAFYEFIVVLTRSRHFPKGLYRVRELMQQGYISSVEHKRWLAPLIACLTIFGWIYLFQGLAPEAAIAVRPTPEVQKTVWAITPGGAINFLAFVGLYLVIPELVFFQSWTRYKTLKQQRSKVIAIAVGLLVCFLVFPPLLQGHGIVDKMVDLLPHDILKLAFFYCLSLITCLRFSQPELISFMVLFNSLIMIKAYPWDKYILPLVVVFWYLKSINFGEAANRKLRIGATKLKLKL